MSATYDTLRAMIAFLAFALPLILRFGGQYNDIDFRPSMSDYYWASHLYQSPPCSTKLEDECTKLPVDINAVRPGTMRSYFVGFLFAVGAILIIYRGYTTFENWLLNFAGAMAVCIALFPMDWTCARPVFDKHGVSAGLFFLAIAIDCIFCSRDTLGLLHDRRVRNVYFWAYVFFAIFMVGSMLFAWRLNLHLHRQHTIYWIEFFGIYSFAAYWVVKTTELHLIGEQRAVGQRTRKTRVKFSGASPDTTLP